MSDSERFLREVGDRLPFDPSITADVVAELEGHLEDSTNALIDAGVGPHEARRRAIQSMGDPAALADEIRRAHQTPERLLAAAGAGAWTAGLEGLRGLVIGTIVSMVLGVLGSIAVMLLREHLPSAAPAELDLSDGSANTLMTVVALAIAAYYAGRRVPQAVARASRRSLGWARAATGFVLATVALYIGLFGIRSEQSLETVVGFATLPLWATLGAWHAHRPMRARFRGRKRFLLLPAVATVAAIAVLGGSFIVIDETRVVMWADRFAGWEAVGSADLVRARPPLDPQSRWLGPNTREVTVTVLWEPVGYTDLRFEYWSAADLSEPGPPRVVTTAERRAVIPIDADVWAEREVTIQVDLSTYREIGKVYVLITGLSPAGDRYLLNDPVVDRITLEHTAMEWILAR